MSTKRSNVMKRAFDILVALSGLIIFAPIIVLVSLYIRWKMGSPILFTQVRPGLDAKPFTLMKFRTMTSETDPDGNPLPDEQRLTNTGKFLRRLSLDELPQLVNVLRGDMSLVGPRPLLMEYLPHYSAHQARRHEVRPGITGWAQVNGRNALDWPTRLDMDVWYVENASFLLDLKIIAMTVLRILKSEGVTAKGHATMYRFDEDPPE